MTWGSVEFQALNDPSWFSRLTALETMARTMPGRSDLGPVVSSLMAEPDPAVRDVVVCSLTRWNLDRRTTLRTLAAALRDEDAGVRKSAVDVAGAMGAEARALIPALEMALTDRSRDVRAYTALALAVIQYEPLPLVPPVAQQVAD